MEVKRLDWDIISMLPENIIEMILTLMPIRDAVRTSVLSRKWRYNWANISKLVFDDNFFEGSGHRESFYAIYQVLLLHHGPILEFTLNMYNVKKRFEIDQIILHLSRKNTLKKFTLNGFNSLPSSFYSLRWLTHLNLVNCRLQSPSTFNGFNMLTTIYLDCIYISAEMLLHLVSGCPLLKSCTLVRSNLCVYLKANAHRLRQFGLNGCYLQLNFGVMSSDGDDSSIIQLFECLSMVEHLHLGFSEFPYAPGEFPRKLPNLLVHLKYLHLSDCILVEPCEYAFPLLLIRSSPYLEKIKIEIIDEWDPDDLEWITPFLELQDYSDVRLDHLTEFEIERFVNVIPESELLKLILIKSPILKKARVKLNHTVKIDEENKILKSILRLPRASPVAEIIVEKD